MENMVKLKEEFDYKSLSRRLEVQLDNLIEENERQQKAFVDEIERITVEAHNQISEAEKRYANALEVSSFCVFLLLKYLFGAWINSSNLFVGGKAKVSE